MAQSSHAPSQPGPARLNIHSVARGRRFEMQATGRRTGFQLRTKNMGLREGKKEKKGLQEECRGRAGGTTGQKGCCANREGRQTRERV